MVSRLYSSARFDAGSSVLTSQIVSERA